MEENSNTTGGEVEDQKKQLTNTTKQIVELPATARVIILVTLAVSALTLVFMLVMMSQISGQLKAGTYVVSSESPLPSMPVPDNPHWSYWLTDDEPPEAGRPRTIHDGDDSVWYGHFGNTSSEYRPFTQHDGNLTNWESLTPSSSIAPSSLPIMFYDWYPPDPSFGDLTQYSPQHEQMTTVYSMHDGTTSSWVPYGSHDGQTTSWGDSDYAPPSTIPQEYDVYPDDSGTPMPSNTSTSNYTPSSTP